MPIHYDRSDARRLVVLTVTGAFDMSEFRDALQRHTAEGTWAYGLLWDLRSMHGRPTDAELSAFRNQYVDQFEGVAQRGPVALLVGDMELYRVACQYFVMVGSRIRINVFRERTEAEAWLVRNTRR